MKATDENAGNGNGKVDGKIAGEDNDGDCKLPADDENASIDTADEAPAAPGVPDGIAAETERNKGKDNTFDI